MKSCIPLRILWNCYLLKSKTILQMKNIALPWYIFSLKKLENINSELTFAEWKFKLVWMSFFVEKYVECQACLLTYFSMNDACSSFESNNFANQHNAMLALLLPYNCPAGWVCSLHILCVYSSCVSSSSFVFKIHPNSSVTQNVKNSLWCCWQPLPSLEYLFWKWLKNDNVLWLRQK